VAGPWALRELYRTASGLVRCRRTAAGFAECGSLRQATQQSARRAFEGALNPSGLQASSRSRNATIHKVTSRSQIRSCCTLLRFAWQQSSHYGRDCGGRARGLFSIFQLPSRRASCLGDARGLPIGTDSLSKSAHLGSSNYKRQLCSGVANLSEIGEEQSKPWRLGATAAITKDEVRPPTDAAFEPLYRWPKQQAASRSGRQGNCRPGHTCHFFPGFVQAYDLHFFPAPTCARLSATDFAISCFLKRPPDMSNLGQSLP
jgi:hypothetical protein